MSEEYIEKANELYDILGDEYALSLSTKFVDGINDRAVQVHVDTQTSVRYASFEEVIRAYTIATTSIRRQEMALRKTKDEPKQDYQQMVQSMGELFKGLLVSANQDAGRIQEQGRSQEQRPSDSSSLNTSPYQPIVGAIDMGANVSGFEQPYPQNQNMRYQSGPYHNQRSSNQNYLNQSYQNQNYPDQNYPNQDLTYIPRVPQDNPVPYFNQQNRGFSRNVNANRRSRDVCYRCG